MKKGSKAKSADEILEMVGDLAEFRYELRKFLRFSETAAEAGGVTAQQYQLLQVIAAAEDDGPTIAYVAERMLLKHNSAVELINRAEAAGLVERARTEEDNRCAMLEVTDKGEKILARLVVDHLEELKKSAGPMMKALRRLEKK